MNTEEFRKNGKEMIDYICNYMENIDQRDVAPGVDPGFLKALIPEEAPQSGEGFKEMLEDVENKIMPGIVHWNHPNFFAYFPSGNSFPSILGDLLSSAIGAIGFSWAASPSLTELEQIVLNWYAKALDLPKCFLSEDDSKGGGVLQGSASECALVCMLAARARAIKNLQKLDQIERHESVYLPQLVAYSSKEAHSSIEKAAKMALVKLRILETDKHGALRGKTLKAAIERDLKEGLTPFFVVATLGTTSSCCFDNLLEIGQVCQQVKSIWFHVDGAYAGSSFILPEMRRFKEGLEYADSFNTNPNKLLLTNFDASAMWVKDVYLLSSALTVDPLYLQHEHTSAIDFRHYGIPLSRRFRALKLWFVFRSYGIAGLQRYIRNHIRLAKHFEKLVREDNRFEVRNDVHLGLVCFRLKCPDHINRELLARINHSGKFHMTPAMVKGKYIIRFCVTYEHAKEEHIDYAWKQIKQIAEEVLVEKPQKALTRTLSARYSFTRTVSREIYERQTSKNQLTDGATPIVMIDTDSILNSLHKATLNNQRAASGMTSIDSESTSDDSTE
uniref:CSON004112 protein n=1 Tax=Culicoides sonorensis TaxID=179676 RepID=A0A336L4L2_CULSO